MVTGLWKLYLSHIWHAFFPLVTKLMERVRSQASLIKLAPRSIFPNRNNWSSADEMVDEASQYDEYMGGSFEKIMKIYGIKCVKVFHEENFSICLSVLLLFCSCSLCHKWKCHNTSKENEIQPKTCPWSCRFCKTMEDREYVPRFSICWAKNWVCTFTIITHLQY